MNEKIILFTIFYSVFDLAIAVSLVESGRVYVYYFNEYHCGNLVNTYENELNKADT